MQRRRAIRAVLAAIPVVAVIGPSAALASSGTPQPETLTPPNRQYEPVVLTGSEFADWSAGPEVTFRAPQVPTDYGVADAQGPLPSQLRSDCYTASPTPDVNGNVDQNHNDHNCYQSNQLPVRTLPGRTGVDPNSLRGYVWDAKHQRFEQIPFQVDTKWIHYITNNASGFAFYSGADQETTYTYDREGFRFTTNAPFDPANPAIVCQALPDGGLAAAKDPNPGLIDTDEMAFMAHDATPDQAPSGTTLPRGITDAHEVVITDPLTQQQSYVYVMRSATKKDGSYAVDPAYTADNSPYVHYQRDANAGTFVYSQSSYNNYGVAPKGPVCTPDGKPVIGQGFKVVDPTTGTLALDPKTFVQRRPLDTATVTTPRYRFRYDGRWVMDDIQVSPDDQGLATGDYGPNIVDRWKARAFQQSPGGDTPCCGYEEETTNWGGSSQLMGEKVGPVRVIRSTWGADSSTNNVRTEIFYADQVNYQDNLRVHVIPPLDGIYTQRDMAAGRITTYYNPYLPNGVPVAGINEEAFGNFHAHVGPDGVSIDSSDTTGATLRSLNPIPGEQGQPISAGNPTDGCSNCIHGDFDEPDAMFSGPPGLLQWEELDGPNGALVERWNVKQVTPVGTPASAIATMPYYRDDSCFDDGTGNDPGPKIHLRSKDEPTTWWYDPATGVPVSNLNPPAGVTQIPRRCWNHNPDGSPYNIPGTLTFDPKKPVQQPDPTPDPAFSPQGDVRYFQGDVGTHGLHIQFIADSDNAQQTVPVDEIDSEQREVILAPKPGNQPVGNVGEQYGHAFDKPLLAVVSPVPMQGPGAGAESAVSDVTSSLSGGQGGGNGRGGNGHHGAGGRAAGAEAVRLDGAGSPGGFPSTAALRVAVAVAAAAGGTGLTALLWAVGAGAGLRRRRRRARP